jgi:hypothetical protein
VWAHVLLLAVVLILLMPVVGTQASFSADEGAAIIEAKSLAAGHGWIVEHPLHSVDPTGKYYPLELSARGPAGYAPFAKHPLYAVILAGADRVAGTTGMVLLSVLGTVVAAALGAAIAGRLDPRLRRPAVWARVLSPLLFDGYLVIAHTLGAACVAGAALAVIVAFERRSVVIAAGAGPLLALAVLLRTEAQLLAVALAVTVLVVAVRRRDLWPAAAAAAAASVGGAYFAKTIEHAWALHIVGGRATSTAAFSTSAPYGFLGGRLNALGITWLLPSYDGSALLELALIVMLASVIMGAFVARRRPQDHAGLMLAAVVGVAAAVVAFAVDSDNVVPGLLVAFPLGVAGALLVDRAAVRSITAKVLTGTFVLFALAVLATQYPSGGSGEWGGRYFAIGLPLAVPMVLLGLSRAASRLASQTARLALAGLVACATLISAMGVMSLRDYHQRTGSFVASLDRAASANPADRPVLISTVGAVPRFAWQTFDRERWLLAHPQDLGDLAARLTKARVGHALLVTDNPAAAEAHIGSGVHVTPTNLSRGGWTVLDLRL